MDKGIAASLMLRKADVAYGAVIIWAYLGIVVKEAGTTAVAVAAIGSLLVVAPLIGASLLRGLPLGRLAA